MSGFSKFAGRIGSFFKALFDNPITRGVRAVASALVGIPVAIVATVALGTAYGIASAVKYSHAHFHQTLLGGKKLVINPVLEAATESIWGAIGSVWTGFGLYAPLKAAEIIREQSESFLDDAGYGDSSSDPASPDNIITNHGPDAVEKSIQKRIEMASGTPNTKISAPLSHDALGPVKHNSQTPGAA